MMSLAIAAEALQGTLVGRDATFTGVNTDSRNLGAGELFVALVGPRFDGHNFLAEAIHAGAAGALVSRAVETTLPYVLVRDTRLALGELAAFWRGQFDVPVIGVTGSNGKTTVKEMIGAILGDLGPGCVTQGNLNNDIGAPLTLLRLRASDRYAVIEMGMNHPGEIAYLSRLTRPTIALINNAAEAHLEGLGGLEGIARAKGEIFSGMAEDGTAVLNADDAFCELWRGLAHPRRIVTFGLERPAEVSADFEPTRRGSAIHLKTPEGDINMSLPLLGRHNVMNALAAGAAARAAGASLQQIQAGLEKLRAVSGRLELKEGINGAHVIDDTYNANPGSVAAGLQVLKDMDGERVLVLGDMAELGFAADDIHRRVGELARRVGVGRLFALGERSRLAVEAFGRGGRHFDSHEALIEALIDCLHGDMTVLVKGSRVMKMDKIVSGIVRAGAEVAAKGV
jgi:UDP-N-acetylmuramoyl-tripeptide--D-alanyl-D-alanine ligase